MKRNFKNSVILSTTIAFALTSIYSCNTNQQNDGNWESLFNGKDLTGWKTAGGDAKYLIEDDAIVGVMTKGTPNSFLITEKNYGDFILELDVKLEGNSTNSGVQTRSHFDATANEGRGKVYGRQVEIDPTDRAWTGGIYDEGRREWLYPLDLNPDAKSAYKAEEFNHIRIEAIGNETKTWVNGIPTSYVVDSIDNSGFIGLQVHSIPDSLDGKKVYFKNIKIDTTDLQSKAVPSELYIVNTIANNLTKPEQDAGYSLIFNGTDHTGWHSARGGDFPENGWKIQNGILSVQKSDGGESTNGGDIVTDKLYKAFDLSFDFKLTPG